MKSKKGLKPGMQVKNLKTGNIAELRADSDHPRRLCPSADFGVFIRRRLPSGKWTYSFWVLKNIELVKE